MPSPIIFEEFNLVKIRGHRSWMDLRIQKLD